MTPAKTKTETRPTPGVNWAVPAELGIPPDPLRLRLDLHHQAVTMTFFDEDTITTKIVSALDVAQALASDLSFGSGLLPPGAIWWQNTRSGPLVAIYVEPQIWPVALQTNIKKPAVRYRLPMPGLIFLCQPGAPPWVYAVMRKPLTERDPVFKAPLCNVFANGRSCPGSHKYPTRIEEMVESFFTSFFSQAGDTQSRSKKFPGSVVKLWQFLDGKKKYPLPDLVPHGTIADLMNMEVRD